MDPKTAYFTFAPTVSKDATGLPKRFSGIAYSGGIIPGYGWSGDAAIDLASLTLPVGAIFALVDHDPEKRAGKLTARLEDNKILVDGEFFTATESGREVAALFAEGAPWQMSVGLQAKSSYSDTPTSRQVNGQTLQLNTLFTDALLREVSFVPVGADPHTSVAAFSKFSPPGIAALSTSEGDNMTLEQLQAKVAELEGSLTAEKTRADAAESKLTEIKAAARKDAVTKLAADLGRDLSDDESKTLTTMDDGTFVVMSATLRSFKVSPARDSHLFSEQATGGKPTTTGTDDIVNAITARFPK